MKRDDWEPFETCRMELFASSGSWVIWPSSIGGDKKWSLYCEHEGAIWHEAFESEKDAKRVVLEILRKDSPGHPYVTGHEALRIAREGRS